MIVLEDEKRRVVKSENYNTFFNKKTGFFARWGKTEDDDPIQAPMPEIADIEISSGKCHNSCPFCYKQNTFEGKLHNMTFEEFKNIFHKLALTTVKVIYEDGTVKEGEYNTSFDCWKYALKKSDIQNYLNEKLTKIGFKVKDIKIYNKGLLSQIAFGITSPYDNPDFFKMMEYAREFDVIPNYTINGTDMTEEVADKTVELCGACAVSCCSDLEKTYNAVKLLTDRGLKQVNIHCVAMQTTYDLIIKLINDVASGDIRVKDLNAIVLLKYKPKGTNAGKFKPLTLEQYKTIFNLAREKKVGLGFDSCSAPVYLETIKDETTFEKMAAYAEPCESTLFSIYINSYGECSPCSFTENECRDWCDWDKGISVLNSPDFESVWNNERIKSFRERLLSNGRKCPMFNLED